MAAYGTGSCARTCDSVRMLELRCDRKVSPPTASALECIMYYYLSKSAPAAKIFPTVSECARPRLILTQKNPCWTCIVNPLDLLDFQGFDGRGRPTDLPPKPATRLCTGLLGGFGCLAHVFLGKDERPRAQQHSHRRARLNSPRPYSMRTLLRPRTGAPHFGCGCAALRNIGAKASWPARALGWRLPVVVPVKIPKILQLHELDVIIRK